MFDPLDFENRDGLAYSGWPFSFASLKPFYDRAQWVCQLGTYGYAPSDWGIKSEDIPQPFTGPHFVCQALQNSPPTIFGRVYRTTLDQAERLSVYLNDNALRFAASDGAPDVKHVECATLSGNRFILRARIYVLATGAVKNARMLLLSQLGNQNDLVGHFFMTHLEYTGGVIALTDPFMNFRFRTQPMGQVFMRDGATQRFETYISLSEETRRARKLPHLRFFLSAPPKLGQCVSGYKTTRVCAARPLWLR